MTNDEIPDEALDHLDKLAKMNATFTRRRKKEVLEKLGYYD